MADEAQGTEVDFNALQAPFPDDKIQWRIRKSGTKKNGDPWAKIVPYPDARALMDRLDEVCGPHRWRTDFITGPQGGVICSLAIRVDGAWVAKEDGAENTDIESVKGGLTDAFKRVCVMWNVGGVRLLYRIGDKWAEFHQDGQYEDRIEGEYHRWDPPELKVAGPPERGNYEGGEEKETDGDLSDAERIKQLRKALWQQFGRFFAAEDVRTQYIRAFARHYEDYPDSTKDWTVAHYQDAIDLIEKEGQDPLEHLKPEPEKGGDDG